MSRSTRFSRKAQMARAKAGPAIDERPFEPQRCETDEGDVPASDPMPSHTLWWPGGKLAREPADLSAMTSMMRDGRMMAHRITRSVTMTDDDTAAVADETIEDALECLTIDELRELVRDIEAQNARNKN